MHAPPRQKQSTLDMGSCTGLGKTRPPRMQDRAGRRCITQSDSRTAPSSKPTSTYVTNAHHDSKTQLEPRMLPAVRTTNGHAHPTNETPRREVPSQRSAFPRAPRAPFQKPRGPAEEPAGARRPLPVRHITCTASAPSRHPVFSSTKLTTSPAMRRSRIPKLVYDSPKPNGYAGSTPTAS